MILERYLSRFDVDIEALVLGCTHYPILEKKIRTILPSHIDIINPGFEAAQKFVHYLRRHPKIETTLSTGKTRQFFATGDTEKFQKLGSEFVGFPIKEVRFADL